MDHLNNTVVLIFQSWVTFDEFWGSLDTSIFGNSNSAANNTQTRLPSTLFPFLMTML